jgi:hypothetical protein
MKESVRPAVFEHILLLKRIQERLGYMLPKEYFKSLKAEEIRRTDRVA